MKLSQVLIGACCLVFPGAVAAADDSFVASDQKPYNFRIQYSVADKQDSISDVVSMTNGETYSLDYTVYNGEDEEVSIIGVGGSLNDPQSGAVSNNLTTGSIGPVVIPSGEAANFTQQINIDVAPGDYLVVPSIYAVYNSSMMLLGSRSQLISVEDPSISIFNPQLLLLELILLATLGGALYAAYELFGKQYLRKNQPIKVATIKKLVPADQTSSSKSSGYDESWLPKQHLKAKKLKRT